MTKKRRRKRKRNLLIAGVGALTLAGGAAAMMRSRRELAAPRNSSVPTPSTSSRPNKLLAVTQQQSLSPRMTAPQRRARGLGKLTKKQRNRLENKYGYNFQTERFGKNISKSSKRKGVKILRSLGRFKKHFGQLAVFSRKA